MGDKDGGQVAQEGIAACANELPGQAKAPGTGITPAAAAEGTRASAAATLAGPHGRQSAAAAAPAAAGGASVTHQSWAGAGKRSKRGRVDEDSQTEYIVIPPKAKKRSRDLLTEHQREVAQRQRQGDLLDRSSCERCVAVDVCHKGKPSVSNATDCRRLVPTTGSSSSFLRVMPI